MLITASSNQSFIRRFITRLTSYSYVGVSTFLFDLALIWLFTVFIDITQPVAIGVAFFIAVHVNYLILRFYTYRKTPEKMAKTYVYFMFFALAMSLVIPTMVLWMTNLFDLEVFVARIAIAGFIGLLSFLFNTFFNFKFL